MTNSTVELVPFVCDRCQQPITQTDDGVLFVTHDDRDKAVDHARSTSLRQSRTELEEQARRDAGESVFVSQSQAVDEYVLSLPVASWQVAHDRCLAPGENDTMAWYAECGRIRTFRPLMGMALHLEEKEWVKSTNLRQRLLDYSGGF